MNKKKNSTITACILDPRSPAVREAHARYRNIIQRVDAGKDYTSADVGTECLATIAICGWYCVNTEMDISLSLVSVFSPVRYDASDEGMVVTVEDRRSPAFAFGYRHFMYDHYRNHMNIVSKQGGVVDLKKFPQGQTIGTISEAALETFFSEIGFLDLGRECGIANIAKIINEQRNPYP